MKLESSGAGTYHVFDAEDMRANLDNLIRQIHVVLVIVLLVRVQHYSKSANMSCWELKSRRDNYV